MRLVPLQRRTAAASVVALTLGLSGAAVPLASPALAAETRTVPVTADAYVSAGSPGTNYGSARRLRLDRSPAERAYLRFDLPTAGPLLRGRLQVYVTGSAPAFEVRRVQDTRWSESAITSATAPAVDRDAAVFRGVSLRSRLPRGRWVTVDVTRLLPSVGPVTLALTSLSRTAQTVASREAGSTRAPRLLLDQSTAAAPAVVAPAAGTTYTTPQSVDILTRVPAGVTKVEFFDNGTYQGTEDTAPFSYTWQVTSAANGPHRWTVKAYDAAGNAGTSAPVDVTVAVTGTSPTPATAVVAATAETAPVPHAGDAADDAAIWVHPTDPALSTVIGTDKLGGLAVYDLAGRQLAYHADSTPNNVDIRYDFPLGGRRETIVVTSDTTADALRVYRVDPATRGLVHVSARTLSVGIGLYGLCMYRSPVSGKHYVFDSDSSGNLQQWELFDNAGKVDARKVRQLDVGSTAEGCVADDETGALYLAEEDVAIWRYDAEPTGGTARSQVDAVGAGRLVADIEGLSLYYATGGAGYLIASSQGSSAFAVYDRRPPNSPVTTFTIGAGAMDAVTYTDGLDVLSTPLGSRFPEGVLVVQDDRNDGANQNYKLVPWGSVARAGSTPLLVDTGWDPRGAAPAAPTAPSAVTYYVDAATGDDTRSGTSPTAAWKSLTKAGSVALTPGASLLLARGSVWRGGLEVNGSGSSTAPAVVGAYGQGAAPVVRDASTCIAVPGNHVTVRDLEVRACSWAGIALAGSGNTVERNLVSDTAAGVYVKPGALDNRVLRNRLIDNNRMSVLTETPTSDDSGAFGVLLRGDRTEVAWNTISGSDAFSYDYGRDGAAIEVYGGIGNTVHHNVAVNNDAFSELGASRSADNVFAYNDVRSSLETSVFVVTRGAGSSYGPVLRTTLINNTVMLTGAASQGFVCHAGCGTDILTMRNNIVQAVAKVGYADAAFDEGNGVYFGGRVQFPLSSTSVVASPQFVDAAGGNLRLQASSPAVDRGAVVPGYDRDLDGLDTPMDGNGDGRSVRDVGAYERR